MIDLLAASLRQQRNVIMALAFPIGIWASLWPGIIGDSQNISRLIYPQSTSALIFGIAAIAPFAAAGMAITVIVYRSEALSRIKVLFLGPLGLTTIYGAVGIVSAIKSPDGSVAIYWVAAYLSVPIVLWSVTLVGDTANQLRLIINFTWAIFIVAVMLILAFGLIELNLWNVITHPNTWLICPPQSWYTESSGLIRETGVGRYAAVLGIVSLSGLWQRNWRFLWAPIFLVSIFLLITSGARTSVVGFTLGAPLVILLHGGQKSIVMGLVGMAFLIPIFWITGIHQTFLDHCIWRNTTSPAKPAITQNGNLVYNSSTGIPLKVTDNPSNMKVTDNPPNNHPNQSGSHDQILGQIPRGILKLNGRTEIWSDAMDLLKDSPLIGHGFHADRLLLTKHSHNSYVHAFLQTGVLGGAAFISVVFFTFFHIMGIIKNLDRFPNSHKRLLIGVAGVMAYLLVRSITESTGAFFGVDLLLLAPLLLYAQVMNQQPLRKQQTP